MPKPTRWPLLLAAMLATPALPAGARQSPAPPAAVVDLTAAEGAQQVSATWRTCEARLTPGPADNPLALQLSPRGDNLDGATWTPIEPTSLTTRRGPGGVCFQWYDLRLTLPEHIAGLGMRGSSVVLEIVADDYAEVWVDGRLPLVLGARGGAVPAGFNTPQRLRLTDDARPGQQFRISCLAINGPISVSPGNRVWIRSAVLELYPPGRPAGSERVALTIDRRDPRLAELLPEGASAERLASGFVFTEGPVWADARYAAAGGRALQRGYLLFSDPNANTIYRFDGAEPETAVTVFRPKSGYTGADIAEYRQPGSNGLTFDPQGRLTICQHGDRRVVRVEHNGDVTVLADRFEGKRLNSPNDLAYRSDGALFFTDPPFGLPNFDKDRRKELPHSGVYCLRNGVLSLVSTDFSGPNGLAFSPDERTLYIGNWDERRKVVNRYAVADDGSLTAAGTLIDLTAEPGEDAIDGIKTDALGNVYISGPGGLWIMSPSGIVLGRVGLPEHPHNMAFGDADSRSLYLAAQTGIYRIRLLVPGIRPGAPANPSAGEETR
ncbi:MAG: SMP-30/gluconolactonase/LRE family protein [Phycisphaerales bacterium]|nr:SMP-30/gluconolactonase/LRE family protein [Phycisphaerales bacterium]